MKFTVLGAGGFIGRQLTSHLQREGHAVVALRRGDAMPADHLGHVIYCIGLTGDFRSHPFETVQAHVTLLSDVLERADFESFLYLSSTRLYARASSSCETTVVPTSPLDPSDLYNLSKLMGESLCLACRPTTRIARLSNVVGFDPGSANFLSCLIEEALQGRIELQSSLESEKDYVAIDDVVTMLPKLATQARERIYNLASGRNVRNADITARLQSLTGCAVAVRDGAPVQSFPPICIDRAVGEFGFAPGDPLDRLPALVEAYRRPAVVG